MAGAFSAFRLQGLERWARSERGADFPDLPAPDRAALVVRLHEELRPSRHDSRSGDLTNSVTRARPWAAACRWPIYVFVAVAFWNLVGAGLFGFLINPPIAPYHMQGLDTTPVHGHTALSGVHGMLGMSARRPLHAPAARASRGPRRSGAGVPNCHAPGLGRPLRHMTAS